MLFLLFLPSEHRLEFIKENTGFVLKMELRMEEMYPNNGFYSFGHSSPVCSPVMIIAVTHSKPRIVLHKIGNTPHNILNNIPLFSHSADVQTNSGGLAGLNSFSKCGTIHSFAFLVLKWFKLNRNMFINLNNSFYLPYLKAIFQLFIKAAVGLRCRLETCLWVPTAAEFQAVPVDILSQPWQQWQRKYCSIRFLQQSMAQHWQNLPLRYFSYPA